VAVCNQRGVSEEELRETWTFRRLLHVDSDSASGSGVAGRTPASRPSKASLPANYKFLKGRRPGRMNVVHVEDDMRAIATVLPIGTKPKNFAAIKQRRLNKGK